MTAHIDRRDLDAIVLDIEGTTTPAAFVYEVLFPFARRHLREFLRDHLYEPAIADAIVSLEVEWAADAAAGLAPPPWSSDPNMLVPSVAAYVESLMDLDRKSPGLKMLQGHIWERGYRSGALVSDVFADVAPAIRLWRAGGLKTAIYSSGSVLAQRLLFTYTREGDLTPLLDGFFDTRTGPKTSPDSYRTIAAGLGCQNARLLFVSDAASEIDAAAAAGCRVALCVRPGHPHQSPSVPSDVVTAFDQIILA